ncbi:hypothetical protein SSX86_008945 [Deinandra increscens subsp. villosa]|uniref:Uncharacterized protein n=1 Tax=Deinandra increscens subsp. villosa TaxID=3103831 RepID=A0AAP0H550_9ASTR
MSYDDDYSPAPSGTFGRSNSIDYTTSYTTPHETASPNLSSVAVGNNSELHHFPAANSQRALLPPSVVNLPPPVLEDVRPAVNSSNQLTDRGIGNRAWDPTATDYVGQPQGFSDLVHQNNSQYDVTTDNNIAKSEAEVAAPTISGVAQRDPSNNGSGSGGGTETVNPVDYAGISLVGRRFKLVNPEAYYVEKDDPYN